MSECGQSMTPRTDADAFWINQGEDRKQYQGAEYVRAVTARELEASLAEAVAALKDYLGEYDNPVADYGLRVRYRNNLRAIIAKHSG